MNHTKQPEAISKSNEVLRLLDEHRQVTQRLGDAIEQHSLRIDAVVAAPCPKTSGPLAGDQVTQSVQCSLAGMIRDLIEQGRGHAAKLEDLTGRVRL